MTRRGVGEKSVGGGVGVGIKRFIARVVPQEIRVGVQPASQNPYTC